MDLVTLPFRLPFLPVHGLIRLAELIQEEAEREYHDPATARRQLEEAEYAHARGEISSDELYQAEAEAAGRMVGPAVAGQRGAAPDAPGAGAGAEEV